MEFIVMRHNIGHPNIQYNGNKKSNTRVICYIKTNFLPDLGIWLIFKSLHVIFDIWNRICSLYIIPWLHMHWKCFRLRNRLLKEVWAQNLVPDLNIDSFDINLIQHYLASTNAVSTYTIYILCTPKLGIFGVLSYLNLPTYPIFR